MKSRSGFLFALLFTMFLPNVVAAGPNCVPSQLQDIIDAAKSVVRVIRKNILSVVEAPGHARKKTSARHVDLSFPTCNAAILGVSNRIGGERVVNPRPDSDSRKISA